MIVACLPRILGMLARCMDTDDHCGHHPAMLVLVYMRLQMAPHVQQCDGPFGKETYRHVLCHADWSSSELHCHRELELCGFLSVEADLGNVMCRKEAKCRSHKDAARNADFTAR